MLLTISLTFIGTTMLYVMVVGFAGWRLASHLRGNAPAITAVVENVFLPLFSRPPAPIMPVPAESKNGETILRP